MRCLGQRRAPCIPHALVSAGGKPSWSAAEHQTTRRRQDAAAARSAASHSCRKPAHRGPEQVMLHVKLRRGSSSPGRRRSGPAAIRRSARAPPSRPKAQHAIVAAGQLRAQVAERLTRQVGGRGCRGPPSRAGSAASRSATGEVPAPARAWPGLSASGDSRSDPGDHHRSPQRHLGQAAQRRPHGGRRGVAAPRARTVVAQVQVERWACARQLLKWAADVIADGEEGVKGLPPPTP